MHLRIFAILTLVCKTMVMSSCARKQSEYCDQKSCQECSKDNGCLRCPDRLFLFLQREGMSHHGLCLHTCPIGHFGQRGKDMNLCMKCRSSECERCFSKDFCTRCKEGLQLFKGRCLRRCPDGTFPHQADCLEACAFSRVGDWGEWSFCLRNGQSCGFKRGRQTRTRILSWKAPDENTLLCPAQSDSRECRMRKRCPEDKRRKKERETADERLKKVETPE